MGVLSFFEQIGNFISAIVDGLLLVVDSITNFFTLIATGYTYFNLFVSYMPYEVSFGFVVLLSVTIIYLIVGR